MTDWTELLTDHTYRTVIVGTAAIGLVSGALGVLPYLRRQSLLSDVIAHAALPGTLLAFLVGGALLSDGRNMVALMVGAVVVGVLAVGTAQLITRVSRLRIDTAMAVSLTTFFGAGMLLLRVISDSALPGKGGIQDYLFGDASSITTADLTASLVAGCVALALVGIVWRPAVAHAFDPGFARALGLGGRAVDAVVFTALVIAVVIGVKAVGLVLMVAFVITPPAAARQWTRSPGAMLVLSGLIGGAGAAGGAALGIVVGDVPTGPLIVLTLFAVFVASLLAAPRRSVVRRGIRRIRARRALRRALRVRHQGARQAANA